MPNLEEYKAKSIVKQEGLNIPDGCVAGDFSDINVDFLKRHKNIVLKSQVPVGSRGKKGGIVVTETSSAEDAFRELIGKEIDFMLPEKLLVEEKIDYSAEYYLSVYSCPEHRGPVLMFSSSGGGDVEEEEGGTVIIPVKINSDKISADFFKKGLSAAGGIEALELDALADIANTLYSVYRKYDCKLVEINPLVKTDEGFIVLDAKMIVDGDAFFRQGEALDLDFVEEIEGRQPTDLELAAGKIDEEDYRGAAHFVQLPVKSIRGQYGDKVKTFIGFNCVGTGASLTVMDEIARLGYFPRNFADTSGNPPASKVYRMTRIILSQDNVGGYVFATCVSSQQLDNTARGIIKAFKEVFSKTGGIPDIPAVMLFRGAWEEEAMELLKEHGLFDQPNVKILDSNYTENDLAGIFDKLYKEWKNGKKL
ncbi:MAG: hypothetical protein KJ995_04160 [Candidatus Omnitrophica bacterium]|nr:hypothetical protein [Candidatus Omnitrophota bacterium]MBU1128576.1 hypothetical protein [Candidatus Omnitrophota bacterium]MBU1657244.1 hypothetical protein [Candidatus Omnitrophota bacterium]MBU1784789.1 hypothetical protein [Candidatus Omnitrophota bacterium]MBU1851580.1 hypothetical protein [Candidatus Omnitrophota bacterium]